MGSPMVTRFGMGAESLSRSREQIPFNVDAELIVHGVAPIHALMSRSRESLCDSNPTARSPSVSISPIGGQVVPVVASSADGVEQQTIVLAVERNTKTMEPIIREPDALTEA